MKTPPSISSGPVWATCRLTFTGVLKHRLEPTQKTWIPYEIFYESFDCGNGNQTTAANLDGYQIARIDEPKCSRTSNA